MNIRNLFTFAYKCREFIIDIHTLTYFFIPGVPPVACLEERQFLLSEDNSGDFFSSETPVIFINGVHFISKTTSVKSMSWCSLFTT